MVRDDEARVVCPYCGAPNVVGLDPGGAAVQEYEEDCQVCCQMWRVSVRYGRSGRADVIVERGDESSSE
jgi:transposase-like protein